MALTLFIFGLSFSLSVSCNFTHTNEFFLKISPKFYMVSSRFFQTKNINMPSIFSQCLKNLTKPGGFWKFLIPDFPGILYWVLLSPYFSRFLQESLHKYGKRTSIFSLSLVIFFACHRISFHSLVCFSLYNLHVLLLGVFVQATSASSNPSIFVV